MGGARGYDCAEGVNFSCLIFLARQGLGDFAESSLKSINLRAKFTVAP